MYKINRLKKSIVAASIVMSCVLATSFSVGATTANKTTPGTTTNNTAAQKVASADNSLQSLKLSEGTLSPAFVYNTVQYSASVGENTTSIDVDAVVSDSTATVSSITGNTDLKEGANTVKVVVKAENGNLAAYTIVVTRGGTSTASDNDQTTDANTTDTANASDTNTTDTANAAENTTTATVSGADGYSVADSIPQSVIPADFTQTEATYQNATCKALKFDKGDVVLLYMVDTSSNGALFVYDQTAGTVYPFVRLANGDKYIILLQTPSGETVDDSYSAAELAIDGKSVTGAYQTGADDTADFYLVYAMNSDGNGGWYQYDAAEGTYQRYVASSGGDVTSSDEYQFLQTSYSDLNDKYDSLKDKDTKFIAGLIIALAVFLIVIVNLLLRGGRGPIEDSEEETEDSKGDVFDKEAKTDYNKLKKREEKVKNKKSEDPLDEFEDKDEEAFADFEEEPDLLSKRKPKKEKKKKVRNEDIFDSRDAKKDEEYYDDEEPFEKKKVSSTLDDNLEILDLNDL